MTLSDDMEGLQDYLRRYEQEIELQALKLAGIYSIDLHDLLSRTSQTIWEKWPLMSTFDDDSKRYAYSVRILANHSRNLSRKQYREWAQCEPAGDQLECHMTQRPSWRDPAIEALFKDEEFAIYRAIAQLAGRSRDVMSLHALGWSHEEIRTELEITPTHCSTALARARAELKKILGLEDRGQRSS